MNKKLKKTIESWIRGSYEVDSEGFYNVKGDVYIRYWRESKLPIRFGKVSGHFSCSVNKLVSLDGGPKEVGGGFYCGYNKLISLEGCPKEVGRNFDCSFNKLVSLDGCPKEVGGYFCSDFGTFTKEQLRMILRKWKV